MKDAVRLWRVLVVLPLVLSGCLVAPGNDGDGVKDARSADGDTEGADPLLRQSELVMAVAARLPGVDVQTLADMLRGVPADMPVDQVVQAVRIGLPHLEGMVETSDPPQIPRVVPELPAEVGHPVPDWPEERRSDLSHIVQACPGRPQELCTWDFESSDQATGTNGWSVGRTTAQRVSAWQWGQPTTGPADAVYNATTGERRWVNETAFGLPSVRVAGAANSLTPSMTLPFTLRFYGQDLNRAVATSDGALVLGTDSLRTAPEYLGDPFQCFWDPLNPVERPRNIIAPLWDGDLVPRGPGAAPSTLWFTSGGEAPNRWAAFIWDGFGPSGVPSEERNMSFEVILYEGGRIVYQYGDDLPIDLADPGASVHDAVIGFGSANPDRPGGYDAFCGNVDELDPSRALFFSLGPQAPPLPPPSPQRVWGTDLDEDYPSSHDAWLQSPRLDLRSVDEAELWFSHWYKTERGKDGGVVYVRPYDPNRSPSDNGGWVVVEPFGGYTGTCSEHGGPCFTGQSDWERSGVDLTPWAGQEVHVRFYMRSDGQNPNVVDAGWFIDDVELRSSRPLDGDLQVVAVEVHEKGRNVEFPVAELGHDYVAVAIVRNRGQTTVSDLRLEWNTTFAGHAVSQSGSVGPMTIGGGATERIPFVWTPDVPRLTTVNARLVSCGGCDPNPANDHASSIGVRVHQILHRDSFEGTSRWTAQTNATEHQFRSDWQRGIPTAPNGPSAASNFTLAWGTNLSSPYRGNLQSFLVSPSFEIPTAYDTMWFGFDMWMDTSAHTTRQGGRVDISTDGGATWTVLPPPPFDPAKKLHPPPATNCMAPSPPHGPSSCWFQSQNLGGTAYNQWNRMELDLTDFIGKTVQLRFNFFTEENAQADAGWYIDNITLEGEAITRDGVIHSFADGTVPCEPGSVDRCFGPGEEVELGAEFGNLGFRALAEQPVRLTVTRAGDGVQVHEATTTFTDVAIGARNRFSSTFTVPSGEDVLYTVVARSAIPGDDRSRNDAMVRIVTARSTHDLSVDLPPRSYHFDNVSDPIEIDWTVRNTGTRTIDTGVLNVTVHATGGTLLHHEEIPIEPLGGAEETNLVFSWLPTGVAEYRIEARIDLAVDEFSVNNVLERRVFYGVPPALLRADFEFADPGWQTFATSDTTPRVWERGTPSVHGPGVFTYHWVPSEEDWIPADVIGQRTDIDGDDEAGVVRFDHPVTSEVPGLPADLQSYRFPFFGAAGNREIRVGTNGVISTTTTPITSASPTCQTPDIKPPNGYIAPLWTDLEVPQDPLEGGIYVADTVLLDDQNRTRNATIIQWENARVKATDETVTFQAVLVDNGTIRFHYRNLPRAEVPIMVGIESTNGFTGVRMACDDLRIPFPQKIPGRARAFVLQPVEGAPPTHSGPMVWATSLAGVHPASSNQMLVTPDLDLSGAGPSLVLRFWHYYDTERGRDGGRIVVSTDGGLTWKSVEPNNGDYDAPVAALGGHLGFTGDNRTWQEVIVDLTGFKQPQVRIGFLFASDATVQHAGWYIDDVRVVDGPDVYFQAGGEETTGGMRSDADTDWLRERLHVDLGTRGNRTDLRWNNTLAPFYTTERDPNLVPLNSTAVWATNLDGKYSPGRRQYLLSPAVDLRQSVDPVLTFWWSVDTPPNSDPATIELRANATSPWIPYRPPESGPIGWRYETIVLDEVDPSLHSDAFQVRWNLTSDNALERDGLMVDDVTISDIHPVWTEVPLPFFAVDDELYPFPAQVRNDGSETDTFRLTGLNPTSPGWNIRVVPAEVTLGPGEVANVSLLVRTPPGGVPGVERVVFSAQSLLDPLRRSLASVIVDLNPTARPDLRVAGVLPADSFLHEGKQSVWAGRTNHIGVHIENVGRAAASQFPVNLYARADDEPERLVGTKIAPTIPVGAQRALDFVWVPPAPGNYTLRAHIDPAMERQESSRINNNGTANLTAFLGLAPALALEGLTAAPTAPAEDQPVTVSFRAANRGSDDIEGTLRYEALDGPTDAYLISPPLPESPGNHWLEFHTRYSLENGVDGVALEVLYPDCTGPFLSALAADQTAPAPAGTKIPAPECVCPPGTTESLAAGYECERTFCPSPPSDLLVGVPDSECDSPPCPTGTTQSGACSTNQCPPGSEPGSSACPTPPACPDNSEAFLVAATQVRLGDVLCQPTACPDGMDLVPLGVAHGVTGPAAFDQAITGNYTFGPIQRNHCVIHQPWQTMPIPGPVGRIASMTGTPSVTGDTKGNWALARIPFEPLQNPERIRFHARLDGSNVRAAQGFAIDAIAWRDQNLTIMMAEDFESGTGGWQTTAYMQPQAPSGIGTGFVRSGNGFVPGGSGAVGFGDFTDPEGYGGYFVRDANGTCPAVTCVVATGTIAPLGRARTSTHSFEWVPVPDGSRTIHVRLDPAGEVGTIEGRLPPEANITLRGIPATPDWQLVASESAPPGHNATLVVRVDNPGPDPIRARYDVVVPYGWNASVFRNATRHLYGPDDPDEVEGPDESVLWPGDVMEILVQVTVHPRAAPGDHRIELIVHDDEPGARTIRQTLTVRVQDPTPAGQAAWQPRTPGAGTFTLGNGTATVIVEGNDRGRTIVAGVVQRPAGWLVRIEPSPLRIPADGRLPIAVTATGPADHPAGTTHVEIWLYDGTHEQRIKVPFTVQAQGQPRVTTDDVVETDHNGRALVPVRLVNHGNAPSTVRVQVLVNDRAHHPIAGDRSSGLIQLVPRTETELDVPVPASALGRQPLQPFTVQVIVDNRSVAEASGDILTRRDVQLDALIEDLYRDGETVNMRIVYGAPRASSDGRIVGLGPGGKELWTIQVAPADPGEVRDIALPVDSETRRVELRAGNDLVLGTRDVPSLDRLPNRPGGGSPLGAAELAPPLSDTLALLVAALGLLALRRRRRAGERA